MTTNCRFMSDVKGKILKINEDLISVCNSYNDLLEKKVKIKQALKLLKVETSEYSKHLGVDLDKEILVSKIIEKSLEKSGKTTTSIMPNQVVPVVDNNPPKAEMDDLNLPQIDTAPERNISDADKTSQSTDPVEYTSLSSQRWPSKFLMR